MADENIEFVSNLENLLSPFCYVPEVPLPNTTPEVPGGMYLSGFISQDCTWGCCFNHSVLKCFPVDRFFEDSHISFANIVNNGAIAVSSSSYSFPGGHITCATELAIHNPRTQSGMRKLLLGISYTGDNNNRDLKGAVVIFDPIRCAPMKWIEIPDPVSSITVLSHFEEGGSNRPFFNETMMAMVGIAAVGLRGGSVIIIDLGLDDPNLTAVSASDSKNTSNLTYRLLYVNPHEYVIATKRHKAVSKRSLIALRFSNEPEDEMIADAFHYCKPTGESLLVLNKNAVAVTCLEYVPAIGSLLVGFTCGGFQIWRINNMELQFSSEPVYMLREEPLHVFGFSFQQPVDDPKNYCYIWVMYGNKSAECGNAHVELHSLYYEQKNFIENFGCVYEGFKQCAKRLAFPLIDDFLTNESENEDYDGDGVRCSARPIRIWTQPDTELMYCAWEVGRGGIFYLGTFDLNQWYSNHTKELLYYDPASGLCPYWVALPIEIPDVSNFVMDVRILPKSLMRWENPHAKLDVHLYPSSLSFRAMCLTNTGVSAFEHFGVQEKLIRKILRDGPSLMIEPKSIKKSFVRHGLEPVFPVEYGDDLTEKEQDRFFILTVLLENRRTTPIIYLAKSWLDGSYANVGCTIDLMIDWIAGYTVALRNGADEHWDALFHFPESILPPETVRYINFSNFAWTSLHRLLLTLMGPTEVYTVRRQELENMEFGLGKLVQYSSALLMMYKAQLLPACDRSVITKLSEYYEQRRQESKEALENCIYIDVQFRKSHPLMIDHLMDSLMEDVDIHSEWHVEDGQYCYPPRHVGYLVNMFMWLDADPKAVSRVFMYFLIDLCFINQNEDTTHNSSIVERKVRGDFKAVIEGNAEEYQEILALWLLDHGIPNEILVLLKENDRLYQKDGLPWCAAAVALTAAGYENDVAELLLKSCPHNLAKLLFNLMTSSISKYTSLAELMVSSNLSCNDELLQEFFEISEQRERLAEFVRTKAKELPDRVKTALLAFLSNTNSVKRLSQLLMYYVHTEDFKKLKEEFGRVRDILRHQNLSDIDRKMWRFQETYINHLLNTTKGSMVQQFLRLQSPNSVRPVQSTISIKAINATDDESVHDVTPERVRTEPKLPPHLRRLKLSESVAHDPLSPLRRYAGKIQSMVSATNADTEQEEDARHRRLSTRKSYSRRVSVGRHSILNNTRSIHNETYSNEDRLNATSRNTQVDLIRLLKTPSVDHRAENRQKNSFLSFNQTLSKEVEETNTSQMDQPAPHSIMKEVDPSKPKNTKKVELRFENLSISSEEGDEKNATIYEDADENLQDENNQANAAFDCSFNSATDRSMFADQSINAEDTDARELEEAHAVASDVSGYTNQNEPVTFHRTTELMDITEENEEFELDAPHDEETSGTGDQTKQPTATTAEVESEQGQILPLDEPEQTSSLRRTRSSRSRTPTRESVGEVELTDTKTKSPARRSSRSTRSKSKTPTRDIEHVASESVAELTLPQIAEDQKAEENNKASNNISDAACTDLIETVSHQATDIPNEDKEREQKIDVPQENVQSNVEQTSQQVADVAEVETDKNQILGTDEPEKKLSPRRTRRSSRSRTPTREIVVSTDSIETATKSPARRSIRSTRSKSKTPTREIVHVPEPVSPSKSEQRETRSTRSTRSKTPTRDPERRSVSEDSPEKPTRRLTRSSMTPTRDVHVEDASTTATTKKRRRSSQERSLVETIQPLAPSTSLIFEATQEDMQEEDDKEEEVPSTSRKSNQGKASKSRKRKLNVSHQQKDESTMIEDSGTDASEVSLFETTSNRSTRSMTPTKEIEAVETTTKSPARRSIRNARSKSKTPTREIEPVIEEASPNKIPRRETRGTRSTRSKTPTRDSVSEDSEKPTRRLTRSSKTPMRDVYNDEVSTGAESADSAAATAKKSKRSSQERTVAESLLPTAPSSSFSFEITQEDMQQEDNEEEEVVPVPTTSKKTNPGKISKARKRRLKYLHHQQDLSTVIEDSGTDGSEASVFEATLIPPAPAKADPPKGRKIKGIKARPTEEETEPESNPVKPAKRRKAAATILDFDDDDSDVRSEISTRSTRSASSRRSVDSTKPKTSRRKARSSTKSVA